MAPDDLRVGQAERARRGDIFEIAVAQELGPDIVGQPHPAKERQDHQQDQHPRFEERGEDQQQIELGHRAPDLDEALQDQVGLSTEIALNRAGDQADRDANGSQRQPEEHRHPKAVDEAGEHIAAAIIGAKPVDRRRRRRVGAGREIVDGVETIAVERIDRPIAWPGELLADEGIEIVGLGGEIAAETRLGIIREQRKKCFSVVVRDDRPIVGDEFGAKTQGHQHHEDPKTPPAAPIGAKAAPGAARGGDRRRQHCCRG